MEHQDERENPVVDIRHPVRGHGPEGGQTETNEHCCNRQCLNAKCKQSTCREPCQTYQQENWQGDLGEHDHKGHQSLLPVTLDRGNSMLLTSPMKNGK